MEAGSTLAQGRRSYAANTWADAHRLLTEADHGTALEAGDLELLARAAYMLGRDDDYVDGLERAHHAHLAAGDVPAAVRCAFWVGHSWLFRGETARAVGWFDRGERLLARWDRDCVEAGYLLIPLWLRQMGAGDYRAGHATAARAAGVGERFGDADLVWLARDDQARALVQLGRTDAGLRLVDEALVAVTSGELSPVVAGIVYCNTIAFCQDVCEVRHAAEWTRALTQWCARQPQMIAHNGLCLVHRAEVLQLRGAWTEALAEAQGAAERFTAGALNRIAQGRAHYRQGEVYRLRGEHDAAEDAYRQASRCGFDPQPGLALLRLAQGDGDAAAAALRRAAVERTAPFDRAAVLPAYVEVMLDLGDHDRAAAACRELTEIAELHACEVLAGLSAHAQGAVLLAAGEPAAALAHLRRAFLVWQGLDAPYETARARVLLALACRGLGDEDTATLELAAARAAFEVLAAAPDLVRVDGLVRHGPTVGPGGLTSREVEVLRLVAAGCSNREVAATLTISEHTVARHLQNIFVKLAVTSRTAAGAYAFRHGLVEGPRPGQH